MIHETDRILLGMSGIDLQGSDTGGIVHCGILKTATLFSIRTHEIQEFHIHLDLMAGNLLFVALPAFPMKGVKSGGAERLPLAFAHITGVRICTGGTVGPAVG